MVQGDHRLLVGCPTGSFDDDRPRADQCVDGLELQTVLHPRRCVAELTANAEALGIPIVDDGMADEIEAALAKAGMPNNWREKEGNVATQTQRWEALGRADAEKLAGIIGDAPRDTAEISDLWDKHINRDLSEIEDTDAASDYWTGFWQRIEELIEVDGAELGFRGLGKSGQAPAPTISGIAISGIQTSLENAIGPGIFQGDVDELSGNVAESFVKLLSPLLGAANSVIRSAGTDDQAEAIEELRTVLEEIESGYDQASTAEQGQQIAVVR